MNRIKAMESQKSHRATTIPLPSCPKQMVETPEQRSRRREDLLALGADYVNAFVAHRTRASERHQEKANSN
jgi:hypothetical protein